MDNVLPCFLFFEDFLYALFKLSLLDKIYKLSFLRNVLNFLSSAEFHQLELMTYLLNLIEL